MNTVTKNRVTMIVVPIVLGIALGLGVPAPAHADDLPPMYGGPLPVVVCGSVVHDAPFTCPVVAPPKPCHKWRWWVIRHHHKHYYWACREYPLP